MGRAHTTARAVAAWLLTGTIAAGCSEPTAQPRAKLSVAVVSEPIPGSTSNVPSRWNTFSVDVLLKNQSDVAVKIPGCGPTLERESPTGEWTAAARMICALGAGDDRELPPMGERQFRETIFTGSSSDGMFPGRFRLMYYYAAAAQAGKADEARSAPLELK
jgi:hypothetical protein